MAIAPLPDVPDRPDPGTAAVREVVDLLDVGTEPLGFDFPPHVLRADGNVTDHDTWEFELHPTDGSSISKWLLGYRAPPECWALGGLTGGWTAPDAYDENEAGRGRFVSRPSSHPDAVRVRSLVLMSRSGCIAASTRFADGRHIDDPPDGGLAVDAMRRSFGLPTAPPAIGVDELLTSLWLADVEAMAGASRADGRAVTWTAVANLHPALRLLRTAGERVAAGDLIESAAALGRVLSWSEVRRQVTERSWLAGMVAPELGRWMDDGMLARYLISAFPPLPVLHAAAARRLRAGVAARLDDAVARLYPGAGRTPSRGRRSR